MVLLRLSFQPTGYARPLLFHPPEVIRASISNRSACAMSRIMDSMSSGSMSPGAMSVRTTILGLRPKSEEAFLENVHEVTARQARAAKKAIERFMISVFDYFV